MSTHSSILDWRIPWTEKPGRLLSIEWQRIGHDWSGLAHVHTLTGHRENFDKTRYKCYNTVKLEINHTIKSLLKDF